MTHPITTFLIYTYSAVFNTLVVFVAPVLRLLPAAKQWNILERSTLPHITGTASGKPAVWIHAASLGEAKLLVTFLDILEKKTSRPAVYYLPLQQKTGVNYLSGIQRKSVIAVGFLPFDTLSRYAVAAAYIFNTTGMDNGNRALAVDAVRLHQCKSSYRYCQCAHGAEIIYFVQACRGFCFRRYLRDLTVCLLKVNLMQTVLLNWACRKMQLPLPEILKALSLCRQFCQKT